MIGLAEGSHASISCSIPLRSNAKRESHSTPRQQQPKKIIRTWPIIRPSFGNENVEERNQNARCRVIHCRVIQQPSRKDLALSCSQPVGPSRAVLPPPSVCMSREAIHTRPSWGQVYHARHASVFAELARQLRVVGAFKLSKRLCHPPAEIRLRSHVVGGPLRPSPTRPSTLPPPPPPVALPGRPKYVTLSAGAIVGGCG